MPPTDDNKNEFDGIRVVEDSEPEEVVRLEASDLGPLARKEPSKEDLALPNMMGDADEDEVPMSISPENEWLVAAEAKEVTSVPMGWFVLLFAVMGGVLIWAFSQGGEVDESVDAGSLPESLIDEEAYEQVANSLLKAKEAELMAAAAKDYQTMEDVLRKFFATETVEERLKYVRHPERVRPFMEDHYSRFPLVPFEYVEAKEYSIIPLKNRPFVALSARVSRGMNFPVLLENTGDGYLVDWESLVSYQPIPFDKVVETRPTEPIDLRVYGEFDNFYAHEFLEEYGYLCIRLTAKGSDQAIFGYVQEETAIASEMKKHLEAPKGKKKTQPFILRVRFLPGSKAPRSVLIEEIVSTFWAYPTNPDSE